jgi:hypothetical protein
MRFSRSPDVGLLRSAGLKVVGHTRTHVNLIRCTVVCGEGACDDGRFREVLLWRGNIERISSSAESSDLNELKYHSGKALY